MTDRFLPQNMFQAPLGGRQPPIHPQGPQQPQLDPQQNVQGLSNPQAADRMWQQMQSQQLQSQFPAQLGQDFQQNPQILQDLLRRNMAQNQHIPQKPPMSQFTLQGQMGLHHPLNDSQPQQGFNPQQLPGGLNPQLQQALAARNQQNMASVLGQQNARQLDLLVATNQQNNQQSGQLNYPALRQQFPQQHQQQQHQPPQMQFSQGPQMGQAPFFGDNPQAQVPNGVHQSQVNAQQQNQNPRRPMTFQELRDRAQVVQNTIKDMELQLQNVRAKPEPEYTQEVNQLTGMLMSRKQLLSKLISGMQTMKQQGLERVTMEWVLNAVHPAGTRLTSGAHSQHLTMQSVSPAPPQQAQVPMQQNPQWLQRTGPSPANGFMNSQQAGPSHLPARSPQVPQNQPAMQQVQQQNRPIMPPQIPPRQAQTPLGIPPQNSPRPPSMMANPQFAQQPGTATAAAAVGGNSVVPNPALLMQRPMQPLASNVFASAYAKWCATNGIQRDEALLSYENRPIDLYQLHALVMRAGGFQRVMQSDAWSVIGGQLGFSQLPGNGNEPPRCGPQMAQRLSQVYEKYLMGFDMAYIKSMFQRAFKEAHQQQQQQQSQQQQQQPPNPGQPQQMMHNAQNPQMGQVANGIPNNLQGSMGLQPSHAPQHSSALNQAGAQAVAANHLRTLSTLTGVTDTARLNDLVQYSMLPSELLRAKGVDQNVINVVEVHRAFLQRTFQAQKSFREGVINSQGAANPAAAAAGLMATQRQMAMAGVSNGIAGGQGAGQQHPQSSQAGPSQMMNGQQGPGQMVANSNPTAAAARGIMGQVGGIQAVQQRVQQLHQQQQQQAQQNRQMVAGQQKLAPAPGQVVVNGGGARPGVAVNALAAQRNRPSAEQLQRAQVVVGTMTAEIKTRVSANMNLRWVELGEHERSDWNRLFEQLSRNAQDVESKLPIFACYMPEETLKRLMTMLYTTLHQRQLASGSQPRYFMGLDSVQQMNRQLAGALERYNALIAGTHPMLNRQPQPTTVPSQQNIAPPSIQAPPATTNIPHPPPHPQPQVAPQQPQQQHLQPPRPVQPPQHPPAHAPGPAPSTSAPTPQVVHSTPNLSKRNLKPPLVSSPAAVSTPPASANTPAATSAPTPTHIAASPQTPKSPRVKATQSKAKNIPKQTRKSSINNNARPPPTPTPAPASVPPNAAASGSGPAAATPSASSPAAAPANASTAVATPKQPSTPASTAETGQKRRREEEATPSADAPPSTVEVVQSPPKKARLEPDEPMNETQANRKKEADEIIASGSDEDALKFFEQMQDLMKSQDTLPYEFTEGLDEIIKSCGVPDLSDSFGMSSAGLGGEDPSQGAGASSSLDGLEYFDFSSFGALDDDHESKAATPDLVPTSSTNPSPSSGSEADAVHGSSSTAHLNHGSSSMPNGTSSAVADVAKVVDPMKSDEDPFDPTRLGPFQEVDNGESAYYGDLGSWKWDGSMGGTDSGWAFFSTA